MTTDTKTTATITRITERGYGFGKTTDGTSVFIHRLDVDVAGGTKWDDLAEGDLIAFEVKDTEKGKRGLQISKLDAE